MGLIIMHLPSRDQTKAAGWPRRSEPASWHFVRRLHWPFPFANADHAMKRATSHGIYRQPGGALAARGSLQ